MSEELYYYGEVVGSYKVAGKETLEVKINQGPMHVGKTIDVFSRKGNLQKGQKVKFEVKKMGPRNTLKAINVALSSGPPK